MYQMVFHIEILYKTKKQKFNLKLSYWKLFLPVNPHGHWQLNVLFWIKQVPPLKQLPVTQSGILQFGPTNKKWF